MKILLYSKSNFIKDELKKENSFFKELTVIKSLENIKKDIESNSSLVVLHHLNDFLIFFIYFFRSSTYIFYRFHKDTDRYGRSSYPLRWW